MVNVRKTVLARLRELKRSRYWLAQQVEKHLTMPAVYQYLGGRSDMTGENIERLLDALGLVIVPAPEAVSESKRRIPGRKQTGADVSKR